jgi:hypothetical protein
MRSTNVRREQAGFRHRKRRAWMARRTPYVINTNPAVGFYLSQGFRPAQEVDPDLFAQEPEDIHLVRLLLG